MIFISFIPLHVEQNEIIFDAENLYGGYTIFYYLLEVGNGNRTTVLLDLMEFIVHTDRL